MTSDTSTSSEHLNYDSGFSEVDEEDSNTFVEEKSSDKDKIVADADSAADATKATDAADDAANEQTDATNYADASDLLDAGKHVDDEADDDDTVTQKVVKKDQIDCCICATGATESDNFPRLNNQPTKPIQPFKSTCIALFDSRKHNGLDARRLVQRLKIVHEK